MESIEKEEREENISRDKSSMAALSLSTDTISFSYPLFPVAQEERVKRKTAVIRARNLHMTLGYFLLYLWSTILLAGKEARTEFSDTILLSLGNRPYTYSQFIGDSFYIFLLMIHYAV